MSVLWEVTVSVILSKKVICTCVLFRTFPEMELFHCTAATLFIEILSIVSSIGIYYSSDELVQFT